MYGAYLVKDGFEGPGPGADRTNPKKTTVADVVGDDNTVANTGVDKWGEGGVQVYSTLQSPITVTGVMP